MDGRSVPRTFGTQAGYRSSRRGSQLACAARAKGPGPQHEPVLLGRLRRRRRLEMRGTMPQNPERDEQSEPRRFFDLPTWSRHLYGKTTETPPDQTRETVEGVEVVISGPQRINRTPPWGATGWNAGDIDFRADGAIFIRNPYLADAIERHLQAAY